MFCKHAGCKRMASVSNEYCGSHIPHHQDTHDKTYCNFCKTYIQKKKSRKHPYVCPLRPIVKSYVLENINVPPNNYNSDKQVQNVDISLRDLTSLKFYNVEVEFEIFEEIESGIKYAEFKSNTQEIRLAQIVRKLVEKLDISNFCVIDFGSGKAELLHHIRLELHQYSNLTFVAVDKQSFKFKFDRLFKFNTIDGNFKLDLMPCKFMRLKCDLKDLFISNITEFKKMPILGSCKHLCGEATDFSINMLLNNSCKAFIFAPCCHHRCRIDSLLYDDDDLPLQSLQNFSKANPHYNLDADPKIAFRQIFSSLTKLSSWATLCPAADNSDKIASGNDAKLFIDWLRGRYIERRGFKVQHAIYCNKTVTPENRVMICYK
eukprot:NODE_21_length_42443_cov_0.822808.p9 type:complete len:375 gc:universal NODE_21_length_42443_cov_0.822808:9670-10794(+)